MNYQLPVRTPLKMADAVSAMRTALGNPSREVLLLALAKTGTETGEFAKIWNNNWGNIKAMGSYSGDYTCITLNELINGRLVWFSPEGELTKKGGEVTGERFLVPPGHPQTRMRSYATAADGARDYVDFVSKKKRYAKSWQALLTGDPEAYVRELKAAGYFTASESLYLTGVKWRMGIYSRHVA